jgi:hypothetical protein
VRRAGAPSLLTRIRWRLGDLWAQQDARLIVGLLVVLALAGGGLAAARVVAQASSTSPAPSGVKVVTMREKVRVKVHGHLVTRWRTRRVYARAHTVMQTETIHTPHGTRVVTRRVVRYHVAYRKKVIKVNGKTRTVMQPVTSSQTVTNSRTQVVTNTRQVTETRTDTVTQPVTVVVTTTVVSTETDTVPVTVTVSVPTVTAP